MVRPKGLTCGSKDLKSQIRYKLGSINLFDSKVLYDQLAIGKIDNHDILTSGYGFEDDIAKVVYLSAQKRGFGGFVAIGWLWCGGGGKVYRDPLQKTYTPRWIDDRDKV